MYDLRLSDLGEYDVAVLGGGIAGVFAATAAAREGCKTVIIERSGAFGGVLTEGLVPRIMDSKNKGGLVRELFAFLDERGMSGIRSGKRDEKGNLLPGDLVDVEGCKYFFDKILCEAGVKCLLYSQVASLEVKDGRIKSALIVSEAGNYTLRARTYIDATGSGHAAYMAGCTWDFGEPKTKVPNPVSVGSCITGLPKDFRGTNSSEEKSAYAEMLEKHGIKVSAEQATVVTLPGCKSWTFSANFGYGVAPDDTEKLTDTTIEGRREIFETVEKHKTIPGFEDIALTVTSSHVGIREGRRIYGEYRITDSDILEGRRFDDGVCFVTMKVDVHKMHKTDSPTDYSRGMTTKPYNIPYRALVPLGVDNLLLAGRCISGDFYPHASYRVMGNMSAVGEAAGYAAARCVFENVRPRELDGKRVSEFMKARGYEV